MVNVCRLRLNILRFICVNCDLQSTLITDWKNLQTDWNYPRNEALMLLCCIIHMGSSFLARKLSLAKNSCWPTKRIMQVSCALREKRERHGECEGGKNMESLHNHFEFHNKQQKSNLRTCKKYCTHAMQHATNPSTLPSLSLSFCQLLPLSICRKVCSSLGQQNGIRISGRTHKKRCGKREENVKGKRERVRDMEKLLWFY